MVDINPLKWEMRKSHHKFSWHERVQKRVQDRFTEIIVFCFFSILQKWTKTGVSAPPIRSCPTLGQHSIMLFAFAIWIHHPTLKLSKFRLQCKGNRKNFKNFMEIWAWLWGSFSFLLKDSYLRRNVILVLWQICGIPCQPPNSNFTGVVHRHNVINLTLQRRLC